MNLILFVVTIGISFIIVRIGAIAFELTGLEWSLARFQSLSCFTGTGFTTKEAELVTGNPQRRQIASVLIVLGHAGLVTLVATFANSLRPHTILPKFTIPFLHLVFPSHLLPWINLTIIAVSVYAIYKFFTRSKLARSLTNVLRNRIIKKEIIKPVTFEELLVATGGYGVTSIEVCKGSPVLDKTILESGLRQHDITILAVEREGTTVANPSPETRIILGDKLITFGKLGEMRKKLCEMPDKQ